MQISTRNDIQDLIGESFSTEGMLSRDKGDFAEAFWDLRSGLLGELAQKLVNYRAILTLTGDFTPEVARSGAFRDYVRELRDAGGPIRFAAPPALNTNAAN